MKFKKFIGVLLLCFCMLVSIAPVNVLADEDEIHTPWLMCYEGSIHEPVNLKIGTSKNTREIIILDRDDKEYARFKRNDSDVKIISHEVEGTAEGTEIWYIKKKLNILPKLVYYKLIAIDKSGKKVESLSLFEESIVSYMKGEEIDIFIEQIENLKKEIEELKKGNKIKDKKQTTTKKSDDVLIITDFSKICNSGYATSYRGKWDRVTPFQVGGETVEGDSVIAFKMPYQKPGSSNESVFRPAIRLKNIDHNFKTLKFSCAVDDIAKNYSSKPGVAIYGYSKLLGMQHIFGKYIERNEEIQTFEIDVEKYTHIYMYINTPRNGDWTVKNATLTTSSWRNELFKDYIILKDIQLMK